MRPIVAMIMSSPWERVTAGPFVSMYLSLE
jgi:hypothetical protein